MDYGKDGQNSLAKKWSFCTLCPGLGVDCSHPVILSLNILSFRV